MADNIVKTPISDRLLRDEDDTVPWANKEAIPFLREVRAAINDHSVISDSDVISTSTNYTISTESVVQFTGTGVSTITLPPADALGTGTTRPIYVINNGLPSASGFGVCNVVPAGTDTVNGDQRNTPLIPGSMAVAVSNGAGAWTVLRSTGLTVMVDPAASASVWVINALVKASGDTNHNTTVASIGYTLNFQGHNLPSNIVGLSINATETDLGTGGPTHRPLTVSVGGSTKFSVGRDGAITSAASPINFSHARDAAITSPTGGGTQDTQARAAIDSIRQVLIDFGLTS